MAAFCPVRYGRLQPHKLIAVRSEAPLAMQMCATVLTVNTQTVTTQKHYYESTDAWATYVPAYVYRTNDFKASATSRAAQVIYLKTEHTATLHPSQKYIGTLLLFIG